MKRQAVITIIFLLLSQLLFAQAKTDTIGSYKSWQGATVLTYDGKKLRTMHKITTVIRTDPEAYHMLKKAKHKYAVAWPLLGASLTCLVTSDVIGFTKGPHYNENPLLISSIVLVVASFPFAISAKRNIWKAVRKYNSDIQKTGYIERQPQLYFTTTGTTMGIGLRF